MEYRREIDGLRAVAVTCVILNHAGFKFVSGGFIGVDVFFVISGFLITSVIISERETGAFSLLGFYERRARRILPALFCVVATCIPFAYWLMTPPDLARFFKSVVAVSWFTSNLHFLNRITYFEPDGELKPLLHTWSLAVEEQFYLFFPPLLMAMYRFARRWLLLILGTLAFMSFAFAQWAALREPNVAFFVLQSRAWELLVGVILAIYLRRREIQPGAMPLSDIVSGLGLLCILYAMFRFDESVPDPGVSFLIPTLGTALVIAFARQGTAVGKVLSSRPFVGVGLISYSAYLWHWPLFAFARYYTSSEPTLAAFVILIAATFILAFLSWHLVEQPFRNRKMFNRPQIFRLAGAATAATLTIGMLADAYDGFPKRLPAKIVMDNEQGICRPKTPLKENNDIRFCEFGDQSATRTMVVYGDSHAQELTKEIDKYLRSRKIKGLLLTLAPDCEIIPEFFLKRRVERRAGCEKAFEEALAYLKDRSSEVIAAFRWTTRLYPTSGEVESSGFTNSAGITDRTADLEYFTLSSDGQLSIAAQDKRRALQHFIDRLLSSSSRVYVVYPIPEIGWNLARLNSNYYLSTGGILEQLSIDVSDYEKRNRFVLSILSEFEGRSNFIAIKPQELFCDTLIKGRCVAQFAGTPYYVDDNHLSQAGSKYVVDAIFNLASFPMGFEVRK